MNILFKFSLFFILVFLTIQIKYYFDNSGENFNKNVNKVAYFVDQVKCDPIFENSKYETIDIDGSAYPKYFETCLNKSIKCLNKNFKNFHLV
jgi:hypothetical protein